MSVRSDRPPAELEHLTWKLADIKPYNRNPKTHPPSQIKQIEGSIRRFGFVNPILIDSSGEIIAGHGRYLAAKALGLENVPVIVVHGLTMAERQALRVADNRIAQNGKWDKDALVAELAEIRIELPALEELGFATGELDVLFAETEVNLDQVPQLNPLVVTETGDLWQLGKHRVICGDCRDREVLERLMDGNLADSMFGDAPYNCAIDGFAGGKGKLKHREFAMASGEMSPEAFTAFLKETLGLCAQVSRDGAVHFICMGHQVANELIEAATAIYGKRLNICVWVKSNAGMGSLYRSQHELVFVYKVGTAPHFNAVELGKHGRNRTNCWSYDSVNTFGSRQDELAMHPTVKPWALVADAIKDVTKRGQIVLDPFLGSGTTLIAAERTGRTCYGVEIDPAYVDVALERYRQITGDEPVLVETSETFTAVKARRLAEGAA